MIFHESGIRIANVHTRNVGFTPDDDIYIRCFFIYWAALLSFSSFLFDIWHPCAILQLYMWPVQSHRKAPVMPKVLPWHDISVGVNVEAGVKFLCVLISRFR